MMSGAAKRVTSVVAILAMLGIQLVMTGRIDLGITCMTVGAFALAAVIWA